MVMRSPTFEVLIYGATSGAIAAAVQSARLGCRVALVTPQKHIGGIQIEGLGATDIDNQSEFTNSPAVGGLALEFHRRISKHYGRSERLETVINNCIKDPDIWRFEPKVAEAVILNWLSEYPNIEIINGYLAEQHPVMRNHETIKGIRLAGGQVLYAEYFIEATYEGDLLAAAGISTYYGRESISKYGESLAGVREQTPYTHLTVDIDPYVIPGDSSTGLLYGISPEPFGSAGGEDKHLAAYTYRLPLTDDPSNQVPISKPEGYDQRLYELYRRYYRAGGRSYSPKKRLPGGKTDLIGSEAPLATDLVGMCDGWVSASRAERNQILAETTAFTKGLLYFFTSDDSLPDDVRQEWSRFGYCRDEFPDNEHFPRMMYIRDARRMVSDYVITQHTASIKGGEDLVEDPVAIAYWPTDVHCAQRILRDGRVHNEGFIFKDGHRWKPFGISYRALVPRAEEALNVMTATCPSSSHLGYGAVRLEHQLHALGQACANACDIALAKSIPLQKVPYSELKARLLQQGAVLDAAKVGCPEFEDDAH